MPNCRETEERTQQQGEEHTPPQGEDHTQPQGESKHTESSAQEAQCRHMTERSECWSHILARRCATTEGFGTAADAPAGR